MRISLLSTGKTNRSIIKMDRGPLAVYHLIYSDNTGHAWNSMCALETLTNGERGSCVSKASSISGPIKRVTYRGLYPSMGMVWVSATHWLLRGLTCIDINKIRWITNGGCCKCVAVEPDETNASVCRNITTVTVMFWIVLWFMLHSTFIAL